MVDNRLRVCPACGIELPVRYADRCVCGLELPQPSRSDEYDAAPGVWQASELEEPDYSWLPCDDSVRELLSGGWLGGECWLIYGPGGCGKTRLALRWASHARPSAHVVCAEMSAQVTAAVARSAGARVSALQFAESADWQAHIGRRRALVIDSVTHLPDPVAALQEVFAWCEETGGTAWCIAQVTSSGTPRGGPQVIHEPDAVLRLSPHEWPRFARAQVEKRRLAPPGPAVVVGLGRECTAPCPPTPLGPSG